MKLSIQAGATSQSINVFISDSSSTTGAGLTGLVYNTSSLVAYYSFTGANATATAITLATLAAANSAYSSGGFKEIDATNMPGWYRLDLPDAVLATSKGRVVSLLLKGAANMAPCPVEIELTGWDNQNATNGGIAALPAVAADADGGLMVIGTGTRQLNPSAGGVPLSFGGRQQVWDFLFADMTLTSGSIGKRISDYLDAAISSRLAPTDAGRTLDISSGGEAGIDWANIGSPTTTVALSGTTVKTATDVETDTQDIQSRLPSALTGGKMESNVGAITNGAIVDASFTVPTPAAGLATGILGMVQQVWRRAFKKTTFDSSTGLLKTYANDGTTVYTTETCTEASSTQTKGAAS